MCYIQGVFLTVPLGFQCDKVSANTASSDRKSKFQNKVFVNRSSGHFGTENQADQLKLDQGALGMSDPCGTLQLALKPNSVPRINCLQLLLLC